MEPVQDMSALRELKKAKLEWEREQAKPLKYAFRTPDGQLLDEKAEEAEASDVTPETLIIQLTQAEATAMVALSPGAITVGYELPEYRAAIVRRILKLRRAA